jgi:cytochrome c oxidase subunit III
VSQTAIDVSPLPEHAFGQRSVLWWATMGMVAIEGTVFALLIMEYLYLKGRNDHWPPGNILPPGLLWGTVNTIILLVSVVPNELAKRAAEKFHLRQVQLWLVVCLLFGVGFNVVRIFEFMSLNVSFDSNAYGSIVWALLGFHTVHILTDWVDTGVLTTLMLVGPIDEHRFVDVSENAMYWYFVVLTWLPMYALIYFAPRVA